MAPSHHANVKASRPPTVPAGVTKSLTSQRKHRKMMKDGSGREVWPECVEELFVQGLREYLKRPDALVQHGRNKFRNQFLVSYLRRNGVDRSKKQVASHLQVLRNMLKGHPAFYLVSGPDDLGPECDESDHQHQDGADSPSVESRYQENFFFTTYRCHQQVKKELSEAISFDFDDSDSSSCSSPNFCDRMSDFASSPSSSVVSSLQPPSPYSHDPSLPTSQTLSPHFNYADYTLPGASNSASHAAASLAPYASPFDDNSATSPHSTGSSFYSNRVIKLELMADGMDTFCVDVGAHGRPCHDTPVSLDIQLLLAPINVEMDGLSNNNHGFSAKICLKSIWQKGAQCVTEVHPCPPGDLQSDTQSLDISSINLGTASIFLPPSQLSRCRWFDYRHDYTITQTIVVDGHSLLRVAYHLERHPSVSMPAVTLIPPQSAFSTITNPMSYAMTQYQPFTSSQPTSLSSALTPSF